jgi:hypothetical protein
MNKRLMRARVLALLFLAAFLWHLWQAPARHDPLFYASTVLDLGLAVLYFAIAREEKKSG